jgi:uncharacterized repeat protein (TIGR01451 family)
MGFQRASWFTRAAFLALIASLAGATAPPRPATFFGVATAGGSAAPAGTSVSAWIDGVQYAESTVFAAGGVSVYRLDVPGDLPGTAAVEGGTAGQTVTFKVGGGQAAETGVWQEGAPTRLDLSGSNGPDLSVAVDDGVAATAPGDTLTYTIAATNHGPGTATGVSLSDTLSTGTAFVSASDGGSAAGGTVSWPAFDLAEEQTAIRTVTARVESSIPAGLETLTNTATVADDGSQGLDPNPADNTATDVNALSAAPDLAVTISNGVSQVVPGQPLQYTISLSNAGTREAAGVVLRSTLPLDVTFFAASDSGVEAGGVVTWPSFNLLPGASATRSVSVRVHDPLSPSVVSLASAAEATESSGTDPDPGNDTATDLDPVVQKADLVPARVDPAGATTDPQSLAISGSVSVEVANRGNLDVPVPFTLTLFEDRDGNAAFDAAADNLLGQADVAEPLAAGSSLAVTVPVSGTVLFRGNRISAFVDDGLAVDEHHETNNVGHSGDGCGRAGAPAPFEPVLELNWPGPDVAEPRIVDSASSPVVVDLDGDGVPDVVFTASNFDPLLGVYEPTFLRAIRGDTGESVFDVQSFFDGSRFYEFAMATVAAGDIDLDGRPEVITANLAISLSASPYNVLTAYEHDGRLKWRSAPYSTRPGGGVTNRDNPAIADLDRDGVPEIVVGANVFNNDGTLRWTGAGGHAYQSIFNLEGRSGGAISLVADLDLSGDPEVVTGNTAYRSDGSIFWQVPDGDGYPAVANFDADPFPEIVVVSKGTVRLHEHDGTLAWGPIVLPGAQPVAGGPPTVADFDGDGQPEIGVASSDFYVVFETDGSVKWQRTTQDFSSGMTGSTVFDFEGDGRFEVVYRDERFLRIYWGEDGTVLAEFPVTSTTLNEQPTVADVDGDGRAEILVTADHGDTDTGVPGDATNAGLRVFGDANGAWVGTRRIWNQHPYGVGNVNDDASIPREPAWTWLDHNTFRAQVAPEGRGTSAPDLTASRMAVDVSAYPAVTLTARIGNGGGGLVRAGLPVAYYNGDPAAGAPLLGTAATSKPLPPGAYEDVSFTFQAAGFQPRTATVAADDDGTGQGQETECDEANNRYAYGYDFRELGLFLALEDGLDRVRVGDAVTYALTVSNAALHTATGVALSNPLPEHTLLVSASDGGALSGSVVAWPPFELASGATAVRSLTFLVSDSIPLTATEVVNRASVTDDGAHGPDPTPGNNAAFDVNLFSNLRAEAGGPYVGDESTIVAFDGTGSRDRDGSIAAYRWDLDGDGAFDDGSGSRTSRYYADDGAITVALQVTDNAGNVDTDTATLTVRNVVPTVEAGADRTVVRGALLAVSATFADPGTADTQTATIDWGDGGPAQPGTVRKSRTSGTVTGEHRYTAEGTFTVTVCVADDDGGTGCDGFPVTVVEGWILLGTANATARPGCVQLTGGGNFQAGAAWYSNRIDLEESFDKTFRVYLGNRDGSDGLAFVLHDAGTGVATLGPNGGWLGYRHVSPSIAVELDTYRNYDGNLFVDPADDHAAVNENGGLNHAGVSAVVLPDLEDGRERLLRVVWNAPARQLQVLLDGAELFVYSKDLIESIFAGQSEVYWGLTAASGWVGNEQYFCETAPCTAGAAPSISAGSVRVTELSTRDTAASFPVTLSCPADHEVRVEARTTDGTALAGPDYEATAQTVVFQPGETSKAVEVPVVGDPFAEWEEEFFLDLGSPQGGELRYARGAATIRQESWLLAGDADDTAVPGCFRFTNGTFFQGGAAWHERKLDLTRNFDKTFRVYLGNSDLGVDGLAFVLHDAETGTASRGELGGYLYYAGIAPSIAVEVDTFRNTINYLPEPWAFVDPAQDHLAVNENGALDHRGHPPWRCRTWRTAWSTGCGSSGTRRPARSTCTLTARSGWSTRKT